MALRELNLKLATYKPTNNTLTELRKQVAEYIEFQLYDIALFWAEKVLLISNHESSDVFHVAFCLYNLNRYDEAIKMLRKASNIQNGIGCRYLIAKSYAYMGNFNKAMKVLEDENLTISTSTMDVDHQKVEDEVLEISPDMRAKHNRIKSCMLMLKGEILENEFGHQIAAIDCYKQAFLMSIDCFEAFNKLLEKYSISATEIKKILEQLATSSQFETDDTEFLMNVYTILLQPHLHPAPEISGRNKELLLKTITDDTKLLSIDSKFPENKSSTILYPSLNSNSHILLATALQFFIDFNFIDCLKITDNLANKNPYDEKTMTLHITCLAELKKHREIFKYTHSLVKALPTHPLSFYTVGCYYYSMKKYSLARKYFASCVDTDRKFVLGWLGYGHVFSIIKEHDPALSAYMEAYKLTKGDRCHLPLLYMGAESAYSAHHITTCTFLQKAFQLSPEDPELLNELAVCYYSVGEYEKSEEFLHKASNLVSKLKNPMPFDRWEPIYNNLGHVKRRLKKYDEALLFFKKTLNIGATSNASAYTNIAFVLLGKGDETKAYEYLMKSSSLNAYDQITNSLIDWIHGKKENENRKISEEQDCDMIDEIKQEKKIPTDFDMFEIKQEEFINRPRSNFDYSAFHIKIENEE